MCYDCFRPYKDFTWEPRLEPYAEPPEEEFDIDVIEAFFDSYTLDDFERYGYGY